MNCERASNKTKTSVDYYLGTQKNTSLKQSVIYGKMHTKLNKFFMETLSPYENECALRMNASFDLTFGNVFLNWAPFMVVFMPQIKKYLSRSMLDAMARLCCCLLLVFEYKT